MDSEGFSKFRTALGGFNRSDVFSYIEGSAKQGQKEQKRLKAENARLREENQRMRSNEITLRADMADYVELSKQEAIRGESDRLAALERKQTLDRANRLCRQIETFCDETDRLLSETSKQAAELQDKLAERTKRLAVLVQELRTGMEEASIVFLEADDGSNAKVVSQWPDE